MPILLPRSAELIIALLAVLKAGAAYALLDLAWPACLLQEVVEDLNAPLLVTEHRTVDYLTLPIWSTPTEPIAVPPGFRPVAVDGSDPCCVFFTSGTTGRPKGVLTPHRATARLFQPDGFASFTTDTVMPLATPVPWDAFSLELWSALLNGGTSLLVTEPYLSAHSLRAGVSRHGTNTVWLTSSLFNMIVEEDLEAFAGLCQVMIGGERLSPTHVGRFLCRHPRILLFNGYGPVESTIFATTHRITEVDCERDDGIPLGQPIPGTRIHVLDGSRPCAIGEVGEICIAGEGLALRYVGDTALTGEKFTHVRIGGELERVYRSGDLGMWDPEGLLHFRGRADRQLKIHGHRIEPSEVERQVERLLPTVHSCRVLARREDSGIAHELVAFCVPTEPGDLLKDAVPVLRDALIPHHRPTRVISIGAWPLTAQGKLDERSLLTMVEPAEPSLTDTAPGSALYGDPMARVVVETFGAVLGRAAVPLDVPFVELGGDSLRAGRVCARLAARLARPVPVSRLYRHPTAAALADWLRSVPPRCDEPAASAVTADVPLSPMQLLYLTRSLVDPSDRTGHCLLVWVVEGALDHAVLESAIAAVHRRHEPLRAAYVPDPRPAAQLVDITAPPLEVLPGQRSVDAAAQALRTEFAAELDLASGAVWRTALVQVGTGPVSLFGCVVHHIAFDGWSESVLAGDLAAAYNAALQAEEPAAPSPPSLATVHEEFAERLAQADLVAQSGYLLDELTGLPDLRWPAGKTRPPGTPGRVEVPLAPAVIAGVNALAADVGVSRFVVLLSYCAASLAEVTGQRDFAVGVPVAQRTGASLEWAIGCHINMLCIRLRGAALDSGAAAVRETERIVGRAFAAQDVPFADVLQLVNPTRTGRPPLFQTLFALQDNAVPRLDLAGLRTVFLRQPYLDLPLELHTELWPAEGGGMRLEVSFRPEAVPEAMVHEFTMRFTERLHIAATSGFRQ